MRNFIALCAVLALGTASITWAQDGSSGIEAEDALLDGASKTRPSSITAWFVLPYGFYGFGIGGGGRFTMPLAHDGLIPELNDSIMLELGADVSTRFYAAGSLVITPVAEIAWMFHVLPKLTLYPKIGLGTNIAIGGAFANLNPLYINTAAGALYKVSDSMWLRAESGIQGLNLGAQWAF